MLRFVVYDFHNLYIIYIAFLIVCLAFSRLGPYNLARVLHESLVDMALKNEAKKD